MLNRKSPHGYIRHVVRVSLIRLLMPHFHRNGVFTAFVHRKAPPRELPFVLGKGDTAERGDARSEQLEHRVLALDQGHYVARTFQPLRI